MNPTADVARRSARLWRPSHKAIAVSVGLITAAVAGAVLDGAVGTNTQTRTAPGYSEIAKVQVRDLVETASFDGTLEYADVRSLTAAGQGTLTDEAPEGSRVGRGETLYELDDSAVTLLYGSTPMYRDLASGADDGPDIRQLEANLVALGYDPSDDLEVDGDWTSATTAAVRRWEEDLGSTEDGIVTRAEIVFLPGARVIGEHTLETGAQVTPGLEILSSSSAMRQVSLDVDVTESYRFERGDTVTIQLPNGEELHGRVASVGKVATADPTDSGADPTIAVVVSLRGNAKTGGVDQAPVDVIVETDRAKDVVAVPVSALLATSDGFALEVVDGSDTRMVTVEAGSYADGWVEVDGAGIEEGVDVVVAP